MYFFKSRLRESVRSLLSLDYIQSVPFQQVLGKYGVNKIRNFVQIGSNDGMKNDPLRENILRARWSGILVEPNYLNFQKLVRNYSGITGLIFENAGIAELNGSMDFYCIDSIRNEEPDWYDQVGSFDELTFDKNISVQPELLARKKRQAIPVMTFDALMAKHQLAAADLLHIDAEGYDFKILNTIDFKKYAIRIILFESEWLTSFEQRELVNKFKSLGYEIFRDGFDHMAVKK